MSHDVSALDEPDPSVRDAEEQRQAAARRAEEARRRSETVAIRRVQLVQEEPKEELHQRVQRATRAALEALAHSAEAHRRCAETHEEAARFYERAANVAEEYGHRDKAARYRETATKAREAAERAARFEQEDRVRLAQEVTRSTPSPPNLDEEQRRAFQDRGPVPSAMLSSLRQATSSPDRQARLPA